MVTRLSREKARAARQSVQPTNRPTILIAADTTVSLDGQILGKPRDAAEARSMLTRLRGRSHQVFTAITLIDLGTGRLVADLASTDVPMRDYSDEEMKAYIATGDPFDKAGGYAIQHNGFNPVARMTGCYANVVGLPLCHVTRSLRALGVESPADVPSACQAHLKYECPVFQSILSERPALPR
jgi:MAF protein